MKQRSSDGDTYAETRLRLLDLAEDASLYLRRSADPSVRVAAALLLAASLAACSPAGGSSSATSAPPAVLPLAQEVRDGLPTAPGVYPVSPSSLTRDAQGVYGFSWRNATGPAVWSQGRSSLMRLAQGNEDTLQIVQGQDPILRLKPDTAISMPDDAGTAVGPTPTRSASSSSTSSSSGYYGGRSIAWYPFTTGGGSTISSGTGSTGTGSTGATESVAATTPAYRNPPAAEPGQGSVRGASSSLGAPTTSARTWTSPARAAATGQRGGPGGGLAVSSRSGSTASSSSSSGAARPSSSGFSSGRSGGISGASAAG